METLALNKKGQSLVEVVVALGILAMVFAGVVTLIVEVVNLELSARNKTVAVALAQQKLAHTVVGINSGCGSTTPSTQNGTEIKGGVSFEYTAETAPSPSYNETLGLFGDNFTEVTITIAWENRNSSDNEYVLKQIVKKK
jgi:type II secretory pathway pseudopilin PulG